MFMSHHMNEHTFALIDELDKIANAHDTSVARVALAWLQAQPGVTSTIIGARRLTQLEDNVKALEVKLTADELAHLNEKTKPVLGFPATMQPIFPALHNGGTRVNGIHADLLPFGVRKGEKPY
jgi:diketogulonate reductase-like aldo/keto reductase